MKPRMDASASNSPEKPPSAHSPISTGRNGYADHCIANAAHTGSAREVRIELRTGEVVQGVFRGYLPAALEFETATGRRAVPFSQIPADLQRAFPGDPSVAAERELNALRKTIAKLEETVAEAAALVIESAVTLQKRHAELRADAATILAENQRLTAENAFLREHSSL